jgi:hypothetical protein
MGAGSMEIIYQQMLQRYEVLIHKQVEITGQYRKLDLAKAQVEVEVEAAKQYLQTGFHDPAVKKEFQKLSQDKKDLLSTSKSAQKVVESKTHVVIRILQQHGQQGLNADDIMTLLPSYHTELDRNYLTTILNKLRKRGMAVKDGNKFLITEPGHPHIAVVPAG